MLSVRIEVTDGPISLEIFNIKPTRSKVQQTFFGKVRAFHTLTPLEWVYLGVSLAGLTVSVALTIYRIVTGRSDNSSFTFAVLLMLTTAFCYYYVIDAVLTERADELMVFVISNFVVLIYCIANYVHRSKNTIKLARVIVVSVLSLALIPTGLYQSLKYVKSNHLVFNTVGAATRLQKGCKIYYLCSSLLKFDLQLQLSMLILVMGSAGTSMGLREELILGLGVILTLLFVIIGFVGLYQEDKLLMIVFFVLGLGEPGYVAYKFHAAVRDKGAATYESTFACGCFALVVWAALMICAGYYTKCYFHQGLREKIFGLAERSAPQKPSVVPSASEQSTHTSTSVAQPAALEKPPTLSLETTSFLEVALSDDNDEK